MDLYSSGETDRGSANCNLTALLLLCSCRTCPWLIPLRTIRLYLLPNRTKERYNLLVDRRSPYIQGCIGIFYGYVNSDRFQQGVYQMLSMEEVFILARIGVIVFLDGG